MITPRYPLLQLIPNAVRAYIEKQEPNLDPYVAAGWKARARSTQGKGSANRIVFVPKGPVEVGPARDPGEPQAPEGGDRALGRELASLRFYFTVYFWGYDPTHSRTPDQTTDDTADTGDDMRHAARALHLFELTVQALTLEAWGVNEWGSGDWTDLVKDRRHGAELYMPLRISVAIRDRSPLFARPVAGIYTRGPLPEEP